MQKMQKYCQSCGMPLKNESIRGTQKDGSLNTDYCIYCYKDGSFLMNVSLEEMRIFVIEQMKEKMKIPKLLGKLFTRNMGKLKRWNKQS